MAIDTLTPEQRQSWEEHGFFQIPRFSPPEVGQAMLDHVVSVSRAANGEILHEGMIVMSESNLAGNFDARQAELGVSKIFKLSKEEPFARWISSPEVVAIGRELLGGEVDNFLSQFIFKNVGAWGQPWHQDEYYFPFDRSPQVGLWLAVTEATLENGCLHVLPGSHRERVHEHVADARPGANYGYVEIVDHDMTGSISVTMDPGDLLVFHSRLMHKSTDNESAGIRAAMVFHLAARGTTDLSEYGNLVNEWIPLEWSPNGDA